MENAIHREGKLSILPSSNKKEKSENVYAGTNFSVESENYIG